MTRYSNANGNSSVTSYEISADSIIVEFDNGSAYLYTYSSTGVSDIEKMKSLAKLGSGLGGYISSHVKKRYARRLR